MVLPLIPILVTGAVRAAPWVIGYFITDKVAETIRPNENGASDKNFKGSDFERFTSGNLTIPSLGLENFQGVPSANNNGFGFSPTTGDIVKLAMLSGAVFVGFKALNEGKKLI
jgi:hypothetical protein